MSDFYCKTLPQPIVLTILPNRRKKKQRNYFKTFGGFGVVVTKSDIVYIPPEFKTDLASIPFGLRNTFSVVDCHMPAAIVHDYLYREPEGKKRGKKFADKLFLRIMAEMGVPKWKRNMMYWGVKFGGKRSWQKSKRKTT